MDYSLITDDNNNNSYNNNNNCNNNKMMMMIIIIIMIMIIIITNMTVGLECSWRSAQAPERPVMLLVLQHPTMHRARSTSQLTAWQWRW